MGLLRAPPKRVMTDSVSAFDPVLLHLPSTGSVPVRIMRHQAARRMAIKLDPTVDWIDLVLPPRTPLHRGLGFLESKSDWVAAGIAAMPPRIPFRDGQRVPILDEPHRIRHRKRPDPEAPGPVWLDDGTINVTGDSHHVPRRVRDFLKELARREMVHRSRRFAARLKTKVKRVSVRDTRSRWGSCTSEGHLSFSWRLIMAPEPVLDYIVAHEVTHLVELNHGPRFWRILDRLVPASEEHRTWLRDHRARLLRYG